MKSLAGVIWGAGLALVATTSAWAEDVTIFAAASLRDAVEAIASDFEDAGHGETTLVFAASSSIARQAAAGAPADVVLLADDVWAAWLTEQGTVAEMTAFAGNKLVLVGAAGATSVRTEDLADALEGQLLAMAQVDAVPAGRYGKAALLDLGLWDVVSGQVVQAANVRAALRFVERGEVAYGVGYASDLLAIPALAEVYGFDPQTHPPIGYFGGAATDAGNAFLAHLTGPDGQAVLGAWGFAPPPIVPPSDDGQADQ